MMGGGMLWMHGWGGLLATILYLAVVFGFVLLLVWAVQRITGGRNNSASGSQSPREIVQLRYARGEITREQYQQRLSDLQ